MLAHWKIHMTNGGVLKVFGALHFEERGNIQVYSDAERRYLMRFVPAHAYRHAEYDGSAKIS